MDVYYSSCCGSLSEENNYKEFRSTNIHNMSKNLLAQRRFGPYFSTQFLGAFNDNVYRNAFAILVTYFLVKENQALILNIALVAFILPYFLFGAIAGQLADKYEKSWLIRKIKVAEIIIMLLGCVTLYFQHVPSMLGILFALGTQSAFFGPIKYSILPQHLQEHEIMNANAYVESGTFLAILFGTIVGGFLASDVAYINYLMIAIVSFSIMGWLSSRGIPSAAAAASDLKISLNMFNSSKDIIKSAYKDRRVFKSILAISWFWFFGSVLLTQFPIFAEKVLMGDAVVATILLATFSIGTSLGAFACSIFSRGRVEIGLIPFGGFGMSYFAWHLSNASFPATETLRSVSEVLALPGISGVVLNLTMTALFSGLFIVPLYAYIQTRSDEAQRSRVIAVNNIINAVFMVCAGVMAAVLLQLDLTVLDVFKVVAILNLIVAILIFRNIPAFALRLISWLLVRMLYRVRREDLHHVPEQGAALLVCNHAGFIDPALLLAELPRPARFVMYYGFYELPIVGAIFRGLNSIPIGTQRDRPETVPAAFESVAKALEAGELVVIFPEGGITLDGEVRKFQPGIEEIIKTTPVPVIPLAIRGMWGTWLSRKAGRAMKGFPKAFMKKLIVVAGEPVAPEDMTRNLMYEKVVALRGPLSEQ